MAKIKNTYKRAPLTKDEIRACLSDFSVFCEKCLLIDDKNGRKIPFVLNRAQRYFAELLLKHVFSTNPQPVTVVVLKARQMGYSTLLCALELYILIRFENNEYASLNLKHFLHLGSMADEMLQDKMLPMIESMHQTFFGDFYMNKDERKISCVGFKGQRRSNKIRYYTANSGESGRGGTAQILVLDECFSGDVEILTENGFIRFDELGEQKVAQWDNGDISFVKPLRKIKKKPTSQTYKVNFAYDDTAIVTGGHNFLLKNENKKSPFYGNFVNKELSDINFNNNWSIPISGSGTGDNSPLTALEKVLIALQADGQNRRMFVSRSTMNKGYVGTRARISFKKERKIKEWRRLFDELRKEVDIKYISKERIDKKGRTVFEFTLPGHYPFKDLTNIFSYNVGKDRAEEIINEMAKWEGSLTSRSIHYGSVAKNNADFFAAMATQAGYSVWYHRSVDNRSETFSDYYRVDVSKKDYKKIGCFSKTPVEYNDDVYCVTVPSGYIVVKIGRHVYVVGNCAFYKDLGQLQRAVGSATPTAGLGLQVFVSTANGINGFYDLCNLAQSDPKMEFMFLPWFLMEDYVLPPDDVDEDNLLDYEKRMIEEMKKWELPEHLHLAKIAWYRDHLVAKKGNDLSAMRQEFPTTWQEPFISSDSPAFPTEKLLSMLSEDDREPLGYAINNPEGKIVDGKEWDIRIYKKPQPGKKYDMIIDPAFGGAEADNTAIRVVEQRTLEDCAVYGTKDEPSDVAELAVALARYYNNAIVNIEKNRGELMLSYMRNLRYNNFYIDRARFVKSDPFKSIGTNITKTTREKGIQRLRALITTGQFTTKDEETLQELLHFNYVGTGASRKAQACGNKPDGTPYHDDHVMALVNWALMLPKSLFVNER